MNCMIIKIYIYIYIIELNFITLNCKDTLKQQFDEMKGDKVLKEEEQTIERGTNHRKRQ